MDVILENEVIFCVIEKREFVDALVEVLEGMDNCSNKTIMVLEVHTQAIYDEILKFVRNDKALSRCKSL